MTPHVPEGFDEFWRECVERVETASLDYAIGPVTDVHPTNQGQTDPGQITALHEVRSFTFRGNRGERLNGWIATPLQRRGPHPGFVWIAPYGRESVMPNQYGTRAGYVSLSFNFFGKGAFSQEKYVPANGYFCEGVLDRSTWVFGSMFQNLVMASRVLADLPSVDAGQLGAMGLSQGGGMAIWLGTWSDRIRAICADMPFLSGMDVALMKNVYRYPLKELLDAMGDSQEAKAKVLRTISYYDTLNHASKCMKPTLVSVGLKDPAVKPEQAQSVYEALPGIKRLIEYDWGHNWHPDMVENNRRWLEAHL